MIENGHVDLFICSDVSAVYSPTTRILYVHYPINLKLINYVRNTYVYII